MPPVSRPMAPRPGAPRGAMPTISVPPRLLVPPRSSSIPLPRPLQPRALPPRHLQPRVLPPRPLQPASRLLTRVLPPKRVIPGGKFKPRLAAPAAPAPAPPAYVWSEEQRERIRRKSYLGPRGYTVWCDAFESEEERLAVQKLTKFQPLARDSTRPAPPPIVFGTVDSTDKWFLPQAQGLALFGPPALHRLAYRGPPPTLPPIAFVQSILDKQLVIVAKCIAEMRYQYARQKYTGIVLQAGCGDGKTVMGIFFATVVVPSIVAGVLDDAPRLVENARRLLFVEEQHAAVSFVDDGEGNLPYIAAAATWPRRVHPIPGAILVLVNKGFLQSQWRKRLLTACPNARIGRIQGPVHEVEGCHFVLGMVQTMWSRSYTPATFAGFQTVIVDEAHCICSPKYFQALRQIVTPFMIGLSATVQKPNGMEEVLFRYVGPIAYRSPVVPTKYHVTVRIVQYACHEDPEYSRLDYNKLGELDYTSTIVRVSNFPSRIDAAADALLRFTQENPKTQIIVLSTLKEPLEGLAERIRAWNRGEGQKKRSREDDDGDSSGTKRRSGYGLSSKRSRPAVDDEGNDDAATFVAKRQRTEQLGGPGLDAPGVHFKEEVSYDEAFDGGDDGRHCPTFGFYVGGMKEDALEESSAQQIILATYSMAAEALDIPTLDAVFLYNSKATITQSIGRAMRCMNDHKFIYDFADAHSVFQGQLFKKRLPVYRENGYFVYKTTYNEMAATSPICSPPSLWKSVYLPPGARATTTTTCGRGSSSCNSHNDSEDEEGGAFAFGCLDDSDDDDCELIDR